jgi:hypothetical protein
MFSLFLFAELRRSPHSKSDFAQVRFGQPSPIEKHADSQAGQTPQKPPDFEERGRMGSELTLWCLR